MHDNDRNAGTLTAKAVQFSCFVRSSRTRTGLAAPESASVTRSRNDGNRVFIDLEARSGTLTRSIVASDCFSPRRTTPSSAIPFHPADGTFSFGLLRSRLISIYIRASCRATCLQEPVIARLHTDLEWWIRLNIQKVPAAAICCFLVKPAIRDRVSILGFL